MPRYGSAIVLAALASLPACTTSGSDSAPGAGGTAGTTHGSGAAGGATATGGSAGTTHGSGGASGGVTAAGGSAGTTRGSGGASGGAGPASGGSAGSAGASGGARPASGGASTTGGASGTAGMTHGGSTGGADTTGGSGGNAGDPGGATGGTGGAPVDTSRCDDPGLTWRSANKTNYTSYPDPGSEECVKYNGCMWAGQFAACNDQKPEAWVAAHDIVAAFPDFGALELHDLCLRRGTKRLVVTVLDTCGDSDCGGCCTENQGSADELIDVESYTNARWGVPDGAIEWADLGPTSGGGCD